MPDLVTLRQLVDSFGDALETFMSAPLPMSERGAAVRVYAGRKPFEVLEPPVAVLYFNNLTPAPIRVLDPVILKNVRTNEYGTPMDEIIRPIPFDLHFHVGLYAKDYEDYLTMTERLVANWTDHCIIPVEGGNVGVGVDLQNIIEQNVQDFGVYGKTFIYKAWVWLASLPKEVPEVLEVHWALDRLTVVLDWQQTYQDSGGFPPPNTGQRVIVRPRNLPFG